MSDVEAHPGNGGSDGRDLTPAVMTARRGLRRDVSVLVDSLERGELYVPLARSIRGVPHGEQVELDDELNMVPHLLIDSDEKFYCVAFTKPELLEPVGEELGWTTDDGPLEYCALPARLALDMAMQVVDEDTVLGLVINPLHESELFLRREELGSIATGRAIPLVGYVREIPMQEDEHTLIADPGDPPPAELTQAIELALARMPSVKGYRLERTFNPDRDLEPHPTLTLTTSGTVDRGAITTELVAAIQDKVPPPGYIDILFEQDPD
jgi:hypothetical protein